MSDLANVTHYVYRLYDDQSRLIYVGCSYEPEARIRRHRRTMWWAGQISKIQVKVYPSRKAGLAAESEARTNEHPRWNIESRWMQNTTWTAQQFDDYITAMEHHPNHKTPRRMERIAKAKELRDTRFTELKAA